MKLAIVTAVLEILVVLEVVTACMTLRDNSLEILVLEIVLEILVLEILVLLILVVLEVVTACMTQRDNSSTLMHPDQK